MGMPAAVAATNEVALLLAGRALKARRPSQEVRMFADKSSEKIGAESLVC